MMIKIDLERNIYLDELFIKRCIKTCVRQFKSIRDIKEGNMIVVRCRNEYIEDGEWKKNELTLNCINENFIITHLDIQEQTYINKEFTKEELIRYLDTLYMQRIETGFVEACFSYLSNLNK